MNIIDAIKDPNLFLDFFGGSLASYRRWMICLRAIYGLPIKSSFGRKLVKECTGRDAAKLPKDGFQTALILTGRRSGKSRIASTIAAYSATLAGLEKRLAPGEIGQILVCSPTGKQSKICAGYIRALLDPPMLRQEIVSDRRDSFELRNKNQLLLVSSDYRSTRGFSVLACVLDEAAFLGLHSSRVRQDSQLVQSLQPALATTGGKLIAISSPYAKLGWVYRTFQKHWGNDASQETLVWRGASRTMNPTLPQLVVDRALAEDYQAARSEYLAEFRDDVAIFVPIELLEALVIKNRFENIPRPGNKYHAFVDLSGGRGDASALAIAHKNEKGKVVLDALDYHPAPHNPFEVVHYMAKGLHAWGVRCKVVGDAYSAEFAASAFANQGIGYTKCPVTKAQLYAELLPRLCAGDVELLDHDRLIKQLASLERRTRAGGKDVIDHPPKAHDDLANAFAGACYLCSQKRLVAGAVRFGNKEKVHV